MAIWPNFTEDYVCCSIDVYFTLISSYCDEFSIKTISRYKERDIGADAILRRAGFRPFYMQFKRPKILMRKFGPDRLVFDLRYEQHKVLREKFIDEEKNIAYVCPCFLDKRTYRYRLLQLVGHPLIPFPLSQRLGQGLRQRLRRALRQGIIPDLPLHVCIEPLEEVEEDELHRYTFLRDGTGVEFCSEPKEAKSFQTFDKWVTDKTLEGGWEKGELITEKNAEEMLTSFIERANENLKKSDFFKKDKLIPDPFRRKWATNGIDGWMWFGDYLRAKHRIYQYGFVAREEKEF